VNNPYIGFSNETLREQPRVKKGDVIVCPHCSEKHVLKCGQKVMDDGSKVDSDLLLYYNCGDKVYLAAIANQLIIPAKADVTGEI
jgi:hypothetical protein